MADREAGAGAAEREIVLTRVFDAPRELVFRAWTEPERLVRWWGPNGFTVPHCTIDLRPGGVIHFCLRSSQGQDIWCRGVYREIVAPERIVVTSSFSDENGNPVPPSGYGMSPEWPAETLMTVTFSEQEGRTTVTLRQAVGSAPDAERAGSQRGWNESFDRLAVCLASA